MGICSYFSVSFDKMMRRPAKSAPRRQPKQRRARLTVDAVLEAAVKVLKREGSSALTTNRIAEVAGVSIGSVYQYFPDKGAILAALHRRHIEEVDRMIEAQLLRHATSSLDDLIRALIEAMVEAHTADPELYELLMTEVPHRADGTGDFAVRQHSAFRLAIASRTHNKKKLRNLDKTVFIVANMVEALSHGVALRRPRSLSLRDAKEEAVGAVLAYMTA